MRERERVHVSVRVCLCLGVHFVRSPALPAARDEGEAGPRVHDELEGQAGRSQVDGRGEIALQLRPVQRSGDHAGSGPALRAALGPPVDRLAMEGEGEEALAGRERQEERERKR